MIKKIIFVILTIILANTYTFATNSAFAQTQQTETQITNNGRYDPTTLSQEKPVFSKKFKCIECSVITPLFTAVSSVVFLIYDYWRINLIAIIGLCFGYWLLTQIYGQIKNTDSSYGKGKAEGFLKEITKKLIKITAVICALAMTPQFFMRYTVEPIMYASTFIGERFISVSEKITGNKIRIEYTEEKYKLNPKIAQKQAFSEEIKNNLNRITKNFSSVYTYGILLGQNITIATVVEGLTTQVIFATLKYGISKLLALIPYVGPALSVAWEKLIDVTAEVANKMYIAVGLIGVGLVIIFFLIALRFFTVICGFIIHIGIATVLIPFAIAAWPFDELKSKLELEGYIKNTFLGQIGNLAMFCIILAFCTYILEVFMMIEYISFNGETLTIKEYIAMLDQTRYGIIGAPSIISIIWQNIDLPIVFICFALCVLYLIENVPNYTKYFIAPVDTTASNLIWKNLQTIYKKFASVGRTYMGAISTVSNAAKKQISQAIAEEKLSSSGPNTNPKTDSNAMGQIKSQSFLSSLLFNNKQNIKASMTGISKVIKSYKIDSETSSLLDNYYPNAKDALNKNKLKRRLGFEQSPISQQDKDIINQYIKSESKHTEAELFNKLSSEGQFILVKNEIEVISKKNITIPEFLINKINKNENLQYKKPNIDKLKTNQSKELAKDISKIQTFKEQDSKNITDDKLRELFKAIQNIKDAAQTNEVEKSVMEIFEEYKKSQETKENMKELSEKISEEQTINNKKDKSKIKDIATTILGEQINIYEQLIDYMEENNMNYSNSNIGKFKKRLKKLNSSIDNIEEEMIDNQGNIEVYIEDRESFFKQIFKDRTIMEFLHEKHLDKRQIRKILSSMYDEAETTNNPFKDDEDDEYEEKRVV